jgi:hypothetical protein
MKMLNLRCLHVPTNNVDEILKVRLNLGQIMKFTYHPSVKSSIDWFDANIMLNTSVLMHGNTNWCGISHVEFIKEISGIRCLVKQETMCGELELDKILSHRAQVSHTKLCHQLRLELGYSMFVIQREMMIIFVVQW